MNRDEAIARALAITSAVTQQECEALWDYVFKVKDNPNVVEIGSYLGRSSIVIGLATQEKHGQFYMVDPFYETDIEKCCENVANAGVQEFTVVHKRSELAGDDVPEEIDFIFDDGDHQETGVYKDCELYIPRLKQDGYILFHDYESSWVDVKKVINSRTDIRVETIINSLAVCRKV